MKYFFILVTAAFFSLNSCATRVITHTPITRVVYVKTAPKNHRIVRVKGRKYYYWNGKHYKKSNRGYLYVKL